MDKTIAAIATPPGEGGVAVIRISGKEALEIADKIFSGSVHSYASHTAHFGKFLDIDEGLLLVMRAPSSYTGEDTVELNCHGGSLITRRLLQAVLDAGAAPAGPGEFTLRAFQNGKIDLAQAEAVQALIGAKNALSLAAAQEQLSGTLSTQIFSFQQQLIDIAATLEAWVDFPEEGLEFASKEDILASLKNTLEKMEKLESTFYEGKKIHEGISLCLIGAPNAGKSSLMNALLGRDRAIVTPMPGTTRDLVDAELAIGSLHFHLTDTAGIRTIDELAQLSRGEVRKDEQDVAPDFSQALVEREGIKRSQQAMASADLILLLIDCSTPLSRETQDLLNSAPQDQTLVVWNKIDLPHTLPNLTLPHQIGVSAKTHEGIDQLKQQIERWFFSRGLPEKGELLITNERHKQALSAACRDLQTLITGLNRSISPEFLASDMRSALGHLSSIIGMDISEEVLSAIFSKFCVGK